MSIGFETKPDLTYCRATVGSVVSNANHWDRVRREERLFVRFGYCEGVAGGAGRTCTRLHPPAKRLMDYSRVHDACRTRSQHLCFALASSMTPMTLRSIRSVTAFVGLELHEPVCLAPIGYRMCFQGYELHCVSQIYSGLRASRAGPRGWHKTFECLVELSKQTMSRASARTIVKRLYCGDTSLVKVQRSGIPMGPMKVGKDALSSSRRISSGRGLGPHPIRTKVEVGRAEPDARPDVEEATTYGRRPSLAIESAC